jgi:hypothetical protein
MATATNPLPYGGATLTKREIFAAMVLQGIMASDPRGRMNANEVVLEAIDLADRLVTALGSSGGGVKPKGSQSTNNRKK